MVNAHRVLVKVVNRDSYAPRESAASFLQFQPKIQALFGRSRGRFDDGEGRPRSAFAAPDQAPQQPDIGGQTDRAQIEARNNRPASGGAQSFVPLRARRHLGETVDERRGVEKIDKMSVLAV